MLLTFFVSKVVIIYTHIVPRVPPLNAVDIVKVLGIITPKKLKKKRPIFVAQ
jgi:hypothetical protein